MANSSSLQNNNPFLPIHPFYRCVILIIYSLNILDYLVIALTNGTMPIWELFLAKLLNIFLLLLPFIFYKNNYGWFHPLIFPTAINALRTIGLYLMNIVFGDSLSLIIFENDALTTFNPGKLAKLYTEEQLLLSLGQIVYYLTFFYLPSPQTFNFKILRSNHLSIKSITFTILSILIFYTYLSFIGGLEEHLRSWQGGRKSSLEGIGAVAIWIYAAATSLLIWFTTERSAAFNPLFYIFLITILVSIFLVGGSRSYLLVILVISLLIWIYREKKFPAITITLGLVILLLAAGALGNVRSQYQKRGHLEWDGILNFESSLIATQQELGMRASARKAVYPILASVPQEISYLYGKSYIAALFAWVPRKLWSNKPGLIDGRVGETFFDLEIGIPPGPIGEAYWNFGYLGIPLIFGLFGIFHKWLVKSLIEQRGNPIVFLLYIILLFNVYPVSSSVISALIFFGPAILLLLLFGIMRPAKNSQI